jgi:hypothetical protein
MLNTAACTRSCSQSLYVRVPCVVLTMRAGHLVNNTDWIVIALVLETGHGCVRTDDIPRMLIDYIHRPFFSINYDVSETGSVIRWM